jgi:hypothetical protein
MMAEGVGFEPTDPCGSPVFKTGALNQLCHPSSFGFQTSFGGFSATLFQAILRPMSPVVAKISTICE